MLGLSQWVVARAPRPLGPAASSPAAGPARGESACPSERRNPLPDPPALRQAPEKSPQHWPGAAALWALLPCCSRGQVASRRLRGKLASLLRFQEKRRFDEIYELQQRAKSRADLAGRSQVLGAPSASCAPPACASHLSKGSARRALKRARSASFCLLLAFLVATAGGGGAAPTARCSLSAPRTQRAQRRASQSSQVLRAQSRSRSGAWRAPSAPPARSPEPLLPRGSERRELVPLSAEQPRGGNWLQPAAPHWRGGALLRGKRRPAAEERATLSNSELSALALLTRGAKPAPLCPQGGEGGARAAAPLHHTAAALLWLRLCRGAAQPRAQAEERRAGGAASWLVATRQRLGSGSLLLSLTSTKRQRRGA